MQEPVKGSEEHRAAGEPPEGVRRGRLWSLRAAAVGSWRLLRWIVRRSGRESLAMRAAALAFISMLSIVPLLAALSRLEAGLFAPHRQRIVTALTALMPYSEARTAQVIEQFVRQSEGISGLGILGFMATSFSAFLALDEALNRIWNVRRRRPGARLATFLLAFLWAPALLALPAYLGLAWSEPARLGPWLLDGIPAHFVSNLLATLVLTALYRFVPEARVRLAPAFVGGLAAALALAQLRELFSLWVHFVAETNQVVYGSFAAALFVLLALQLTWYFVLLGSVLAHAIQHRAAIRWTPTYGQLLPDGWLAAAIAVELARRDPEGSRGVETTELGEALCAHPESLDVALAVLAARGWLWAGGGRKARARLLTSPHALSLAAVLAACEPRGEEHFEPSSAARVPELERWRCDLATARGNALGATTIAELAGLAPPPTASNR